MMCSECSENAWPEESESVMSAYGDQGASTIPHGIAKVEEEIRLDTLVTVDTQRVGIE